MLNRVPKKFAIAVGLFLFAFGLYLSYGFGRANLYQARDLHRALGLLDGHWIWHGPDLTGGGRLPGAFFYWLMAIPLSISATIEAAHVFLFAMTALAATLLWFFLESAYSRSVGLAAYFLFLNSAFIKENVQAFWNPTYLFPFLVLAFGLWLGPRFITKKRLVAFGLLCGLMLQIHGTALVLVFAAVITILRTVDRDFRERLQLVAILAVATFLPLIPYYVWRATLETGATSFNDGRQGFQSFLFPIIKATYLWKRSLTTIPENFVKILKDVVAGDLFLIGAIVTTLGARSKPFSGRRFFKVAFVLSACLVPWLLFEAAYFRYAIPFFFLVIIALAIGTAPVAERRPSFFVVPLVAFYVLAIVVRPLGHLAIEFSSPPVLALLVGTVASSFLLARKDGVSSWRRGAFIGVLFAATIANAVIDREPDGTGKFVTDVHVADPEFGEMKEILRFIADRTQAPYDFVREHTVFLGIDRETDLSFLYEQVMRETAKGSPASSAAARPDGILVASKPTGLALEKREDVMPDLATSFAKGEVVCGATKETKNYVVCLYSFVDRTTAGKWNNIGYPYRFIEPLPANLTGKSGLVSENDHEALFFATECQRPEPSCYVYFRLSIEGGKLRARAYGDPIGMPDAATNPAWILSLKNVKLAMSCGGNAIETIPFAARLGFNRFRDSFLAPYERVMTLPCAEPTRIELILDEGQSIFLGLRATPLVPYRFVWERTP